MTTVTGNIAVGTGVPPSEIGPRPSYLQVSPTEIVTTGQGVTMLPFPAPTLIGEDGSFSVTVDPLPEGYAYEWVFVVNGGQYVTKPRICPVPLSGTVAYPDLEDVVPIPHVGWGAPSWVADVLEALATGGSGGEGLNAEGVRDVIGAALVAGTGVTITVDDAANTITIASPTAGLSAEEVRDLIGATLVQGSGITVNVDDGADTITISAAGVDAEAVRDLIGETLVAGENVTITVNDAANTVTIAAAGGEPDPGVFTRYVPVSTGSEARPAGPGLVLWVGGTTQPVNMQVGDVWLSAGAPAPAVAPVITTTSLPGVTAGVAFSQTLAATGTSPIAWALASGALPAGLSLNTSTGAISGTPSAAGSYNFTIRATNGAGSDTQLFTGTVAAAATAPNITTTTLGSLAQGAPVSVTLEATGTAPISWSVSAGSLPAGLTLNSSTGQVTGTPTTAGGYSFTIQATNMAGSDTQSFSGSVTAAVAPSITTTTLAAMTQGQAYSQAIAASGSTPMTWGISAGALPTGLSINSSTGQISGTPTTSGAYSFTVQAVNSVGSDTQAYSGTVAAAANPPVITTTSLSAMTEGAAFSQTLVASGDQPIAWSVTVGSLPTGLSLNGSTGQISGTPTTAGGYSFTVTASNAAGSDTQSYSGTVGAPVGPASIFGSASPVGLSMTVYDDGGGSLYTGMAFYATKSIRVLGVRVWNPAAADSTFLNTDVTVYGYARDWSGSEMTAPPTWASPTQSKAHAAARTAGTWTDVLFDTPITLNAISSAANTPDHVVLAAQYAGGNYYVHGSNNLPAAVAGNDPDVFLAEGGFRSTYNSIGGALLPGTVYGIDILFEDA